MTMMAAWRRASSMCQGAKKSGKRLEAPTRPPPWKRRRMGRGEEGEGEGEGEAGWVEVRVLGIRTSVVMGWLETVL